MVCSKPRTLLQHRRWTLRLFEWGVLACIILVIIGVFLGKVRHLQAEAERLKIQAVVGNLRAAVVLAGILPPRSNAGRAAARPGGNPVTLLVAQTGLTPPGYLGELDHPDPGAIAPGSWYFDRDRRALVYRLRIVKGFESPLTGPARLRLCVRLAVSEHDKTPPLRLESCEPYHWTRKK